MAWCAWPVLVHYSIVVNPCRVTNRSRMRSPEEREKRRGGGGGGAARSSADGGGAPARGVVEGVPGVGRCKLDPNLKAPAFKV